MITADQLKPFIDKGVVAAGKALRRDTRTIKREARRLGISFSTCTEEERYRRQRERARLASKIRPLARQRFSQRQICEALGITRDVLRRIAAEHSININSYQ